MFDLRFSVLLEDGISRNSALGSASLRTLTSSLEANRTSLRANEAEQLRLQAIQRDFLSSGVGKSKTVDEGLARLRLEHTLLAGESKRLSANLKEEQRVFDDLGRGVGRTAEELSTVASVGAAAGLALAGAFAAIGTGAVKTAFEVTDFNRRTVAAFEALGAQGDGSGKKTLAFLDDVAGKLPQSREELARWVKQYEALGITDLGQIRAQLTATASAQAIMGDEGAESYQRLTERIHVAIEAHSGLKLAEKSLRTLYSAGLNVTDVAAHMGMSVKQLEAALKAGTVDAQAFGNAMSASLIEKGQKPLAAMGDDIGILGRKARETFGHFFDDIDVTPITDVIKEVIHIGDVGEPAGRDLKKGITAGVNELVKDIGIGMRAAEWFFLGLEIKALEAKPSIDTVRNAVHELVEDIELAGKVLGAIGTGLSAVHHFAYAPVYAADQFGADADKAKAQGGDTLEQLGLRSGSAARHFGVAPANAEGGVIMRPAPGEYLASVQPGETIVPAGQGGGSSVTIDQLTVNITAPQGVTDAHQLSVTGLAVALERMQLGLGR